MLVFVGGVIGSLLEVGVMIVSVVGVVVVDDGVVVVVVGMVVNFVVR